MAKAKVIRPDAFTRAVPEPEKPSTSLDDFDISAAGVWVLIVASGALCCWYYIDANETPLIMVPLTIGSEIIGARWASHAFDALKNERHAPTKWTRFLMGLACLLLAAFINVSGAHRAIEHLNANANRGAIERSEQRKPYEKELQQIEAERLLLPNLSPDQIAAMPSTRYASFKEERAGDIAALDERKRLATDKLERIGNPIPFKSELPPQIAFALEFLKLFGLFTCARESIKPNAKQPEENPFSKRTQKGWETRRRNASLKHPKHKGKSGASSRH